jgi:hypothetical protein
MTEHNHTPDSLADHLDQRIPPGQQQPVSMSDDPLVQAAAELANAPRPRLPDEAKARIQAQILGQARLQAPTTTRHFWQSQVMRWGLVASITLVVMFVSMVPVTLASVPGDVLYPVKIAIEQIELQVATEPVARAGVNLFHAERRLREASILLERSNLDMGLVASAMDSISAAMTIAETSALPEIEAQVQVLMMELDTLLGSADAEQLPAEPDATQQDMTAHQDPTSTATLPPPTPNMTATPLPTDLPTATPTPLPVDLYIEGPIERIEGNIIFIYGVEIAFAPDDPLLNILEVGDVIRVGGSTEVVDTSAPVITSVEVQPVDNNLAISEDGGAVWRDTGDCSNAPPDWAPAHGWRRRCEGQTSGAPADNPNQPDGNPPGNRGQGNAPDNPGQGNGNPGRGNSEGNRNDENKNK